jgi:hypothetical protein
MLGLSAVAVESEIVGRDNDAELIGGAAGPNDGGLLAATSAACAVRFSLDFWDVEKSWLRRLGLNEEAFFGRPPFSDEGREGGFEGEALPAKGFAGRRGMANTETMVFDVDRVDGMLLTESVDRTIKLGLLHFRPRRLRGLRQAQSSAHVVQFPSLADEISLTGNLSKIPSLIGGGDLGFTIIYRPPSTILL